MTGETIGVPEPLDEARVETVRGWLRELSHMEDDMRILVTDYRAAFMQTFPTPVSQPKRPLGSLVLYLPLYPEEQFEHTPDSFPSNYVVRLAGRPDEQPNIFGSFVINDGKVEVLNHATLGIVDFLPRTSLSPIDFEAIYEAVEAFHTDTLATAAAKAATNVPPRGIEPPSKP